MSSRVLAPSAVRLSGRMWTDAHGLQDYPVPEEMTEAEIRRLSASGLVEIGARIRQHVGQVVQAGLQTWQLAQVHSSQCDILL